MSPCLSVRTRTPERLARRAEVWARMHRDGVRMATIAAVFRVHPQTVAYWLNKKRPVAGDSK